MTEVSVCGLCGAVSLAGTSFCFGCGGSLTPSAPAVAAADYSAVSPPGTTATRPAGIAILAIVEIVVAVAGLFVAIDLLRWANWRFTYDDFWWGVLDLAMGLAYLAASITGFQVAQGLWRLQPWMWKRALTLSLFLLGMEFVSVFAWGLTGLDVIGVILQLSILAYLSLSSVRVLFGRSPTTLL